MGKLVLSITWVLLLFLSKQAASQGVMQHVYYDDAKKNIKISYRVKDTIDHIADGEYTSYFRNGNVASKGYFKNNESVGVWQFFYETGGLKMTNFPIKDSTDYILKTYYYKNGEKSMEGFTYRDKREGIWKIYFEDGSLQSQIEHLGDSIKYTEYYHSGQILANGFRKGAKNIGYWHYFSEKGALTGEGFYKQGKKSGVWKHYYASGQLASSGTYKNDKYVGSWTYFFKNGKISSRGHYVDGKKDGLWNMFDPNGGIISKASFKQGSGELIEYYPTGEIRARGGIKDEKNEGPWTYFYKNGKKKGVCNFDAGSGMYYGYYLKGTLQNKGLIQDNRRVGLWEIYNRDGTLTGYYKPLYDGDILDDEEIANVEPKPEKKKKTALKKNYFAARFPEYRGIIIQGNPFFMFIGIFPISFEFYTQERLGYEFLFESIRSPFFKADNTIPENMVFTRGYAIAIKQKFYNPFFSSGLWYFGHEILFTNVLHSAHVQLAQTNMNVTAQASELKAEYGPLLGIRFMREKGSNGVTFEAYLGLVIGYRNFYTRSMNEDVFYDLRKDPFSYTFRFGINIGYALSVSN